MKAAIFYKKHDIRVEDVPIRKPSPDEVLIKVEACGVCGTDKHIYEGAKGAGETPEGTVLGHELSGTIVEIGEKLNGLAVGDRVAIDPNNTCGYCYFCRQGRGHFCENMLGIGTTVNGGFSEYCTVAAKQVYKIPDWMSYQIAAMAEPIACCLHGIDLIKIEPGQSVLIVGGGTIGLIMLQLAKLAGASRIILVEPVESKHDLARKLGADIVVNPYKVNLPEGLNTNKIYNMDVVIECVGHVSTMKMAIDHAGKASTVMLFGLTDPDAEMSIKPFDLFRKEITVKASFINPYTMQRALDLLSSRKIIIEDLITDVVPLSDINSIFNTDKFKGAGKIIIKV